MSASQVLASQPSWCPLSCDVKAAREAGQNARRLVTPRRLDGLPRAAHSGLSVAAIQHAAGPRLHARVGIDDDREAGHA